ncbi:hypothetical protein V6N13_020794 [Hibiscus sabdariffa]
MAIEELKNFKEIVQDTLRKARKLFATSLHNIIHTLLDQTRQYEIRIVKGRQNYVLLGYKQFLHCYGRVEELVFFASLKEQHEIVIHYYIQFLQLHLHTT